MCEKCSLLLDGVCDTIRRPKPWFQSGDWSVSLLSIQISGVCIPMIVGVAKVIFFFFLFDFYSSLKKNQINL